MGVSTSQCSMLFSSLVSELAMPAFSLVGSGDRLRGRVGANALSLRS